MTQQRFNTAITNPIRTGVQGGVAWGITEILDSFAILPMDERQYAAVLLILTMVVGVIQNGIENWKGIGFLRYVPQPEPTEVFEDGGGDHRA